MHFCGKILEKKKKKKKEENIHNYIRLKLAKKFHVHSYTINIQQSTLFCITDIFDT